MAITLGSSACLVPGAYSPVVQACAVGRFVTLNGAIETVTTLPDIPGGITGSGSPVWVKRHPNVFRIKVRSRFLKGATCTIQPVIKVYGLWGLYTAATNNLNTPIVDGDFNATTFMAPNDGTAKFSRLGTALQSAAGITLTGTSGTPVAGALSDNVYAYSEWGTFADYAGLTQALIDLEGCDYFTAFVTTAATGASHTGVVEALCMS